MTDKNRRPMNPFGLAIIVIAASAIGVSLKTVYDVYEKSNELKIALKAKMETRLAGSQLDVTLLDTYLKAVGAGTIKQSQCDIIDSVTDVAAHDQSEAIKQREALVRVAYLTTAENEYFLWRENSVYGEIKTKAGQLKTECNRIFNTVPVVPQQPVEERQPEWWQRVEIVPDYNKHELVPNYAQ